MSPQPEYAIQSESYEWIRHSLYGQSRIRLHEETSHRARARVIIDVAPESVGLEEPAAGKRPFYSAAARSGNSPRAESENSGQPHFSSASRMSAPSEILPLPAFYKPGLVPGEIEMQSPPYPRGLFVDLMA